MAGRKYKNKNNLEEPLKKSKEERQYWRLMEMVPNKHPYSPQQRVDVVMAYSTAGNLQAIAKQFGIPEQTLYTWRKQVWWEPALRECLRQHDVELDMRLTGVLNKTLNHMNDRLDHGDEVLDKNGELVRKKVSFRDLAISGLGVGYDKRALNRGMPTKRIIITDVERVTLLVEGFQVIAKERKLKVIQGEVIKDEE